jgi:hypothetical protein
VLVDKFVLGRYVPAAAAAACCLSFGTCCMQHLYAIASAQVPSLVGGLATASIEQLRAVNHYSSSGSAPLLPHQHNHYGFSPLLNIKEHADAAQFGFFRFWVLQFVACCQTGRQPSLAKPGKGGTAPAPTHVCSSDFIFKFGWG